MAYYYKHPDLILPGDDCVIWRYMDLSKFKSVMKEDAIFFSKADKQSDEQEGEYPEEMLAELNSSFHQRRQMSITEELLDIVVGFEALQEKE